MSILASALWEQQQRYRDALDLVRADIDGNPGAVRVMELLREAVELVGCLRRAVPNLTVAEIHKAFGSPGDFGYETPIGEALAQLYIDEAKRLEEAARKAGTT
jgi:hypothetical protein